MDTIDDMQYRKYNTKPFAIPMNWWIGQSVSTLTILDASDTVTDLLTTK
jgi:hypothetical protein